MRTGLLAIACLALCLALGEGVLRLAGLGPNDHGDAAGAQADQAPMVEDAVLGWRNRPGVWPSSEPGHAPRTFDADGHRRSAPAPPPPGTPVAVVLGCSFTAAEGIRDEESYVWRLNEGAHALHFENHGVNGYGTHQSWLVLRAVADAVAQGAPPPALVLYGFIGDHERRNVATWRWVQHQRTTRALYVVPPHVTLGPGDTLVEHPLALIQPWPGERRLAWIARLHDAWLQLRFFGRDDVRREATRRLMTKLRDTAASLPAPFAVVLLDNVPDGTAEFLREHDVDAFDCTHPRTSKDPALRVGGVGHPTGELHAHWAQCIARNLHERGLAEIAPVE